MTGAALEPNWLDRLGHRLHRLDAPPVGPGRNSAEIEDLFAPGYMPVPAAVLVALRLDGDQPSLLLTRRAETLAHHPGQVSFPGGRIEPRDGGAVRAALREADEEIGLSPDRVAPIGCLDPLLTITGFRVQPVVAAISGRFDPRLDPREVAEAFEVPLEFLLDERNVRRVRAEYRGRLREWYEFHYDGRRIWGATAAIIVNLRSCIGDGVGAGP